jgi:predicted permease
MTRRKEDDLSREIQQHLELEAEARSAPGVSAADARRAARRAFGNLAIAMEDTREAWGSMWIHRLLQDLRYAGRLMRRSPVVTLVVVLSLALGIGANGAIFNAVDALMLRPLPVADPQRLITFLMRFDAAGGMFATWNYSTFVELRDHLDGISSVAGIADVDASNASLDSARPDGRSIHVALVSGGYFSTLGVPARAGRFFSPADDHVPGIHPVALISDAYRRRLALAPSDVIGHTLKLHDTTYTIVGAMPAGFDGDWVGHPVDLWIPMMMQAQVMIDRPDLLTGRPAPWLRIIARLRPGVSAVAVQASANALLALPAGGAAPTVAAPGRPQDHVVVESAAKGYSQERNRFGAPSLLVMAIVGVVLLIACANVAVLLLSRAEGRRGEMAVRAAIGASRARLVRQSLTESLLLAAMAGAAGLLLAVVGTRMLEQMIASGGTGLALGLDLNLRLVTFTAAVSAATALVFGLMPVSRVWRQSFVTALNERAAPGGGSGSRFRAAKALVVVQVALALVLLVAAGLFARTLRNLETLDLGVDRSHVLLVQSSPEQEGLQREAIAELMQRLPDVVARVPGVQATAASDFALLGGVGQGTRCTVAGYTYRDDEDVFVRNNSVTPGYFDAMGMTLVAGRQLRESDDGSSARVAVVNEAMGRYYWGTTAVVGRRFGLARDTGNEIEIIGVVADAHTEWLREPPARTVFLPYRQDVSHLRSLAMAVRTGPPAADLRIAVRDALHAAAPALPIASLHTVDDNVDQMLATERLVAFLSSLFGGLGAVLTCLGLYGVMSYVTACRTNEIGIRIALGAGRADTLRLVARDSLWLVVAGLLIGAPAAWLTMRLSRSLLFEVGAADAPTMAASVGVMILVALVATWVPARRALAVDPVTALRFE